MKVPMTAERQWVAARVLCELRGLDPEQYILAPLRPVTYTDSRDTMVPLNQYRRAIDVAKEEVGMFVQVLTAVEHSYELLPLSDNKKEKP